MFSHIENLKLLETHSGVSVLRGSFIDRPSHALIFKLQGESRYTFHDKTCLLRAGDVLFIPQGETYTVDALRHGRYCLVNFTADLPGAHPRVFTPSDQEQFTRFRLQVEKFRVLDTGADRLRFHALVYEILASLCEAAHTHYRPAGTLTRLDPAVEYLRSHLFDSKMKIGDLHLLCGISDTYFRRLFQDRFGVTPKKYVLSHRLSHAQAILHSGEYNSIAEVAYLSGFDDPLYFSKVYRAAYRYAPSQH